MGLVLGGGGARGCYEIGAWQAFKQAGIRFDCVAGTSIGALVGAIYTQQTLEPLVSFVYNLHPQAIAEDLFSFPESMSQAVSNRKEIEGFVQKYILSRSGMDISPLKSVIHEMFDYRKFHDSPIDFACMTFNLTTRRAEAYFKKEMNARNSEDIILASASCYPAFPVMKMNGQEYIDGGYWDNVPIDLAQKMGAEKILAFDVEGPGRLKPVRGRSEILNVKPMLPLGNFLDFDAKVAVRNMRTGYLETSRLLGLYLGYLYTFTPASLHDLHFINQYLQTMFMLIHEPISREETERIARRVVGFHPSYLSAMNDSSHIYSTLAETLAYVVSIEPVALYSSYDFIRMLLKKLDEIQIEKMPDHAREAISYLHSLSRDKMIALFHYLIKKNDGVRDLTIDSLFHLFRDEMVLAWTWYFLGEAYANA